MKIVIIALRSSKHSTADFEPLLDAEAAQALEYMEHDFIREIYSLRDGGGVVIIAEAENEDEARAKMAEFPLSKSGMLNCQFFPVKAYRVMKQAADLLKKQ